MTLRKILFWAHLVAGVAAGVIIAVMCLTGAAIAFEKQIVAWAERDVARVPVPPNARRLSIDELLRRSRESGMASPPASITVAADPQSAATLTGAHAAVYYINPYTGQLSAAPRQSLRKFFQTMTEWHRWLGASNEHRATGRAVTGAANLLFFFLALSGLVLWWPRVRSWRTLRLSLVFVRGLTGRARDWNWHNSVGFWCAPFLLVLTATGGSNVLPLGGQLGLQPRRQRSSERPKRRSRNHHPRSGNDGAQLRRSAHLSAAPHSHLAADHLSVGVSRPRAN